MCVINQQGVAGDRDRFHPALDFHVIQAVCNVLPGYGKMQAYGGGSQRVVDAEPAGNIHVGADFQPAVHFKMHAQVSRPGNQAFPRRTQFSTFTETVRFHRTGVSFCNFLPVGIVNIENPSFALTEQQAFALPVFFYAFVLVFSDMVG